MPMSNIMHMRFTADTYYGRDSRRYLRIFFRPRKWPDDPEHVRYVTVYTDRPDVSDAPEIMEKLCPGFSKAMETVSVQAFDEYGLKGKVSRAEEEAAAKASEWKDDARLKHAYRMYSADEGADS